MKKINGLFLLVLILASLAGSLIFWRLFLYRPPLPGEPLSPLPTPTQFLLPSPATPQEGKGDSAADLFRSLKEKFPLAAFLPHETSSFIIDYAAPLALKVRVKPPASVVQVKKEVGDWLWAKGVNPSTHQIDYTILEP